MSRDFLLFGIITVLAFLLLRGCNNGTGTGKETVIIKTDTLREYIKGEPDTVTVEIIRTVKEVIPAEVITINDSVKEFKTNFSDSLAELVVTSRVKGELLASDLYFKPLYPKYITRVDTFKESVVTEIERKRWSLSAGAVFSVGAERYGLTPTLLIGTKKSLSISLGYDLINKTYNAGVYSKIPPLKF